MNTYRALARTSLIIILVIIAIGIVAGVYIYITTQPTTTTTPATPTSTPKTSPTTSTPQEASTTPTSLTPTSTPSITGTTTAKSAIAVTDFRGKTIEFEKPVERIVILSSYWAELLYAIGAGDCIVGIGSYVAYDEYLPDSIRSKTSIGSIFKGVNIEELTALEPDAVIMDCGYSKADELIEQVENMGIPVIGLFIRSIDDELKAIEIFGKITGLEDRANELKNFIETRYNGIKARASTIPDDQKLHVVMISGSSILKSGELSVYANTSWGVTLEDIGAINIALREHPGEEWPKIDLETLYTWDPDVILIASSVSKIQSVLDAIAGDERWHGLRAYTEKKVYVVPCWSSIGGVLDWGPRDIIGREYIASILYPEIYSGIDWRSDMEYLLSRFYDLSIPRQAFALYNIEWKEIVDTLNDTVKIPRKPERVVDFISYVTELAFGTMDKLVGVSKYAKTTILIKTAYPNITEIPSPGSSFSVNIENLTALNPDLVIIWPYKPDIIEEIETLGIPVVKVELYSIDDVKRLIWMFGSIYDMRDRALELINDMDYLIGLVQERIKDIPKEERAKVLYLWSNPTKVQGGKGTVNDFIVLAGGINVAAKDLPSKTYVEVDVETIIGWNPDVIIIWCYAKSYNESTILNDPLWQSIKAVQDGRVYREPYYEHWGVDCSLFVLWLAQKLYPDEFSDINFIDIANEYYMKWYGINYSEI